MGQFISKHFHHHPKKGHGKKDDGITDHDRAVLDLKNARDKLKRYQTKLGAESVKLQEQAKALVVAKKKDRALLLLKMKRYKEQEAQKVDSQLMNVLQMIDTIEWETQQLQVFEALKQGNKALDSIHKIMTVEDVETLMADTADAIAYEQEISSLISGNLTDLDEEEVLKEFEALGGVEQVAAPAADTTPPATGTATKKPEEGQGGVVVEDLPEAPTNLPVDVKDLPEVPTKPLPEVTPAQQEEEEEEAASKAPTMVPA